jgi:hypothetical protein
LLPSSAFKPGNGTPTLEPAAVAAAASTQRIADVMQRDFISIERPDSKGTNGQKGPLSGPPPGTLVKPRDEMMTIDLASQRPA